MERLIRFLCKSELGSIIVWVSDDEVEVLQQGVLW